MNVMDLSPMVTDIEILDSGTESYTESPGAEEESEHSEDSTVCDTDSANCIQKCKVQLHILDKDVSVDEDVLIAPLEPIRECNTPSSSVINLDDDAKDDFVLTSILRRESTCPSAQRKVSFPRDDTVLATYREPENDPPWLINSYLPSEKILQLYQSSCKLHQTIELDTIKNAISEIKNNTNHSATLNLSMVNISNEVNETLEDILKVANFRQLILCECKYNLETISEFFNMLEYYESVCELELAINFQDVEAWRCFCNACMNITVLESISFKGMVISDVYMRLLLHAIESNRRISTLKFDACTLVKLPSFYLMENLMCNTTLSELYLPSSGLYTKEADCLGRFLQRNFTLRVLDISNNCIGDRGLEVLAKGITRQTEPGKGLSVLVIVNNQITEKSGPVISNIIMDCINLHTLNIGYNNLTDEVIANVTESLEATKSLEGLGLQCTLLTCKGIDSLATAIKGNSSLKKINLKGNKAIQVTGLELLCQALTNSKITKIEIDNVNRSSNDPQAYVQLVKRMNAICTINNSFKDNGSDEISKLMSRKVSLSCEPRYILPPEQAVSGRSSGGDDGSSPVLPPRAPTPSPKSRFQITKVEDRAARPTSRFRVTPVPSDEEAGSGAFANARSSVSSNDSVESLHLDGEDD